MNLLQTATGCSSIAVRVTSHCFPPRNQPRLKPGRRDGLLAHLAQTARTFCVRWIALAWAAALWLWPSGALWAQTPDDFDPGAKGTVNSWAVQLEGEIAGQVSGFDGAGAGSASPPSLGDALNAPEFTWTTGGSAVWSGQTDVTHDGVDAAQSGSIADNQESWLQTSVTGPGTVAFWWKVSSEGDFDYLEFKVGTNLQSRISGGVNWQHVAFAVPAATQTLRWRYAKDSLTSAGYDKAWVDEVVFVPDSGAPLVLVQPASQTVVVGVEVTFRVGTGGATPRFYQWFYNETNAIPGATSTNFTLTNVQPGDAGVYSVTVSNAAGSVTSSNAVLTVTTNGPVDNILLLVDEWSSPYEAALINRNQAYQRFTDETFLNLAIDNADPGTTLVIVHSPYHAQNLDSLANYVKAGGRAILECWNLTDDSTLAAAFKVRVVQNLSAPLSVYNWGGSPFFAGLSSPLFLFELNVGVDGQKLQPTAGGQAVGGYVSLSTPNQAALVIGNSNRTVLHGFFLEGVSPSATAVRFAQNEIDFLIGPPPEAVAPFITGQPHSQTIMTGCGMALTVAAAGTPPLSYQWFLGESDALAGATNATLTLTNVQLGDGGIYRVTVSNAYGVTSSSNAVLTITTNSEITLTLLLEDGGGTGGPFETALINQGRSYQKCRDGTSLSFALRSANPAKTVVIIDSTYSAQPFAELADFVKAGGRAILQYWALVPGHNLAATFDVTVIETFTSPRPVYDWGGTSLFRGMSSWLNMWEVGNTIDGQRLEPTTGGQAVAGFVASPSANQAAVVVGNFNRTLVNGFLLENAYHDDYNQSIRFAENEIRIVIETTTPTPPYVITSPSSRTLNPGAVATFSVEAGGTEPLRYQWCRNDVPLVDGANVAGAMTPVLSLQDLLESDEGGYTVVVSNPYGSQTSAVAVLTVEVTLVDEGFNPGANGAVNALGVQADGKILVGGGFTTLVGQQRIHIGRLNPDGTLDSGFNPEANGSVSSLAVQADGKILVVGSFTMLGGQPRSCIGRLNADGMLDSGFNAGANGTVNLLAVQADGKILVAGSFTTLGGQPRQGIGRLNVDGMLDEEFHPEVGAREYPPVYALAIQADGKILVGGNFTMLGGQRRNFLGRLNVDGTLDAEFDPGPNDMVYALAVQADGKILAGGLFTAMDEQPHLGIARLNPNGTTDSGFNTGVTGDFYAYVNVMAVQANGKILVGGYFTMLADQPRDQFGRLYPDGTLDLEFDLGSASGVHCLAEQADGKILVGGSFTMLGGQPHQNIARLVGDPVNVPPSIARQPTDLTVDVGLDATFSVLATGTWPFSYRWLFNETIALPETTNSTLTVSNVQPADAGHYSVEVSNAFGATTSRLAVLTVVTVPQIAAQPQDQSVKAGSNATFSVTAIGPAPFSYQWHLYGTNLSLHPWRWRSGETPTNATLTVTNVQLADCGDYCVVVSNSYGAVTSQVATLEVLIPPTIVQQPVNQTVVAGECATFTVTVTNNATLPIGYQLRKNTTPVTNVVLSERTCTLTLCNVTTNSTPTNGPGSYRIVITNAANYSPGVGSVLVTLTVLPAALPIVTTLPASDVTSSAATLHGTVNPNGARTTAWFEYGLTTSYGSLTDAMGVGSGSNTVEVSASISGLLPDTDYHYRLVATNYGNYGTITLGDDMVVSTEPVLPPEPIISACAMLQGHRFQLQFQGQPGATYSVLRSTNLTDWEFVGPATETAPGQFEFTDDDAANRSTCFYQLRLP